MNRLDVIVRARVAVMGESEEALRHALLADNKNKPAALEWLLKPLEDTKAEEMLLRLRAAMEQMKAHLKADPDGFMKTLAQEAGTTSEDLQREMQRQTGVYASHALVECEQFKPLTDRLSRESLMEASSFWWPISWAHAESDDDFHGAYKAMNARAHEINSESMLLALQSEILQTQFLFFGRWAHFGYPIVQLAGHKYAAALMATSLPADIEVRPPWKTFLIEIPEGLLSTASATGSGEKETVRYLLVNEHPVEQPVQRRAWSFLAFSAYGTTLHRVKMSLTEHLELPREDSDYASGEAFGVDLETEDERTLLLLSRLMLSTCLAMSDAENVKKLGKHPGEIKRGEKEPTCRIFRVGKPVEIDCRQALHDYVAGKRRGPLAVQFLVRGHWRNQACGVGMTARKWIWIEPYWKGPEDAPINMRPHTLGENT